MQSHRNHVYKDHGENLTSSSWLGLYRCDRWWVQEFSYVTQCSLFLCSSLIPSFSRYLSESPGNEQVFKITHHQSKKPERILHQKSRHCHHLTLFYWVYYTSLTSSNDILMLRLLDVEQVFKLTKKRRGRPHVLLQSIRVLVIQMINPLVISWSLIVIVLVISFLSSDATPTTGRWHLLLFLVVSGEQDINPVRKERRHLYQVS